MDQKIFVQNIRRELGKKLPGQTYQYQMAPDDRRLQNLVKVGKPKDAAVLILLSSFHNGPELVFIKRTLYPGPHSGQISFPGGKADPSDPDLEYTALRETQEEIGVPSKQIRIIGSLTPLEIPVSHFKVHPFIGIGDGCPDIITWPIGFFGFIGIGEMVRFFTFTHKDFRVLA